MTSIAIDLGKHVCGTMTIKKTHEDIPVKGKHFLVLIPTSALSKEDQKGLSSLQTISMKTLEEEMSDLGYATENREILVECGRDNYFVCNKEISDMAVSQDRVLSLIKPIKPLPEETALAISQSISKNN